MQGYYPVMSREPVPMAQVYPPASMAQMYPPARSYSLAKLNQPTSRDYGLYEKVRVDRMNGDRRPQRMFDQGLRRQQSYDGDMYNHMKYQSQSRRPEGFDSLQLLGAHSDDRYLDRFMEGTRGRTATRENENNSKNNKNNTLPSTKSINSKNSKDNKNNNKENKGKISFTASDMVMALMGSLANSSSVDNIYESVEQIHYRKTLESMNRRDKIRSVHKTGHPLFDHLREERALASGNDNNTSKRSTRSDEPSRKISTSAYSSQSSGDDEHDNTLRRARAPSRTAMNHNQQKRPEVAAPSWRRAGSAGSESDDDWMIPRPKIAGRKRPTRMPSTDESDSSSKSTPLR